MLLWSVAAIIISKLFKFFGFLFIAKTLESVPSGFTKLRVSVNLLTNCLFLRYTKVFAPLSTNFNASLKPILPKPIIIIFFPPSPLLSS